VLVEPADAPLVSVRGGLGHGGPRSFPEKAPSVSCSPNALPCRKRFGRRSRGPKLAPERETRGGPSWANPACSLSCAGRI
jgi:hypothetical protein